LADLERELRVTRAKAQIQVCGLSLYPQL